MTDQRSVRVSAIMAVYNPNHHVIKAIESVLNQTFPVSEFIIINDGGKEDYIKSVLPDDPRIIYFLQKNGRVAAARNTAIEKATGDYLAFLDQDDYWFSEKLHEQLSMIDFKSEPCMIVSPIQVVDDNDVVLNLSERRFKTYQEKILSDDPVPAILSGNFIYSSTPVIHRDVFKRTGGFESRFEPHDDWAMYLKIAVAGIPVLFYSKQPLSVWRRHSSNESHNRAKMLRTKSRIERFYLNQNLSENAKDMIKLGLAYTNLDRVNVLLYRQRPGTFRKLLPGVLSEFISTNSRLKKYNLPANSELRNKSIKRYIISFFKSLFSLK